MIRLLFAFLLACPVAAYPTIFGPSHDQSSSFTGTNAISPMETDVVRAMARQKNEFTIRPEVAIFSFSPERVKALSSVSTLIRESIQPKQLPDPFWESILTLTHVLEKGPQTGLEVSHYLQSVAMKDGGGIRLSTYWEPTYLISADVAYAGAKQAYETKATDKKAPLKLDAPQVVHVTKLLKMLGDWMILDIDSQKHYVEVRQVHRARHPPPIPSSTLVSPTAYGADWGTAYASFVVQFLPRNAASPDANAGLGFGLGDSEKYVGLELTYSMLASAKLFPWNSPGAVSAKLHRLLPYGFGVAVGAFNLVTWGADTNRSWYGVASKAWIRKWDQSLWSEFYFHLGMGDGNFQPDWALRSGLNAMTVFAGVSARLARAVSFNVNWYGSDLGVGLSITPLQHHQFTITPHIQDLTGLSGSGPRFVVSCTLSDRFLD